MESGKFTMRPLALVTLVIATSSSACSGSPEQERSTGVHVQSVYESGPNPYGGYVVDTTASATLPAAAVGALQLPDVSGCTAWAIQRDVIVTAAHCFCPLTDGVSPSATGWEFSLPAGAGSAVDPHGVKVKGKGNVAWKMANTKNCDSDIFSELSSSADDASADMAVVFLERNLNTVELPKVMPVYTLGDFLDRLWNAFQGGPTFPSPPFQVTGWSGQLTNADNFKRRHTGTFGPSNEPPELVNECETRFVII